MKRQGKRFFSILCVGILCGYSAWKGMELTTIVSILLFVSLIYLEQTKEIFRLGTHLLEDAQRVKFSELELQIGQVNQRLSNLSKLSEDRPIWVELIMSQLNGQQLGLILQIYKANRLREKDGINFSSILNSLRHLRELGLIYHDKPILGDSTEVWLSDLGSEFAEILYSERKAVSSPKH